MDFSNEFRVGLPIEEAWVLLTDVERIAPCLPGAQLTGVNGDEYAGTVKVKVGPVTAQYAGTAKFVEKDAERHTAVLRAEGRDTRGQGNASALITALLVGDADGTSVTVDTELSITGKVAQFGKGVIGDVSKKLLLQFAECLERKLVAEIAVNDESADTAGTPPEAPSAAVPAGPAPPAHSVTTAAPAAPPEAGEAAEAAEAGEAGEASQPVLAVVAAELDPAVGRTTGGADAGGHRGPAQSAEASGPAAEAPSTGEPAQPAQPARGAAEAPASTRAGAGETRAGAGETRAGAGAGAGETGAGAGGAGDPGAGQAAAVHDYSGNGQPGWRSVGTSEVESLDLMEVAGGPVAKRAAPAAAAAIVVILGVVVWLVRRRRG